MTTLGGKGQPAALRSAGEGGWGRRAPWTGILTRPAALSYPAAFPGRSRPPPAWSTDPYGRTDDRFASPGAAQAHHIARPQHLDPIVPDGGARDRDAALLRGDARPADGPDPGRNADRGDRGAQDRRQEAGDRPDPSCRPRHGRGHARSRSLGPGRPYR